jgi:[1-hydroxy-2-(trimethylamino)ethyl]phosphonate dioxygenase
MTRMPAFALPEPGAKPEAIVAALIRLFHERGDAAYVGEPVSQTEHALQTALRAEQAGADSALIAAALLHDVGHLLHNEMEDCALHGVDSSHEEVGARILSRYFGADTVEPMRLHVAAKRYLCATDPVYFSRLSEASVRSLQLQGGPFSDAEAREFAAHPGFNRALALRRWDEEAKVKDLPTPPVEHFREALLQALGLPSRDS